MTPNPQPVDEEKKHEHAFTIPVEWAEYGSIDAYGFPHTGAKVTKLRCACGEEIER